MSAIVERALTTEEVRGARRRQQLGSQLVRLTDVCRERERVIDQVARLTAAQLYVTRLELGGDQGFSNLPVEAQPTILDSSCAKMLMNSSRVGDSA